MQQQPQGNPELMSLVQQVVEQRMRDAESQQPTSRRRPPDDSGSRLRPPTLDFSTPMTPRPPPSSILGDGDGDADGDDTRGKSKHYWKQRAMQLEAQSQRAQDTPSRRLFDDASASFSGGLPLPGGALPLSATSLDSSLPFTSRSTYRAVRTPLGPPSASTPSSMHGRSPAAMVSEYSTSMELLLRNEREVNEKLRQQLALLSDEVNHLSRENLELSESRISESNQWRRYLAQVVSGFEAKHASLAAENARLQAELQSASQKTHQLRLHAGQMEHRVADLSSQLRAQQEFYALQNQELFATIRDLEMSNT